MNMNAVNEEKERQYSIGGGEYSQGVKWLNQRDSRVVKEFRAESTLRHHKSLPTKERPLKNVSSDLDRSFQTKDRLNNDVFLAYSWSIPPAKG